jgi:hypothetical protein
MNFTTTKLRRMMMLLRVQIGMRVRIGMRIQTKKIWNLSLLKMERRNKMTTIFR